MAARRVTEKGTHIVFFVHGASIARCMRSGGVGLGERTSDQGLGGDWDSE